MAEQNRNIQLYEVIRIIEGIPVFLEDHLDRLYNSARLTGIDHLPEPDSLTEMIKKYVIDEKKDTGNIKLSFLCSDLSTEPLCELSFIPHYYPTREEYTKGVKVGLLHADRPNPQAKVQNTGIRDRANQLISDRGLFEVLLVDSEGNITEGSRSNVFFIKDETLYTPSSNKVLQGVTRLRILQLCVSAAIPLIEKEIPENTLDQYDAAFLTGTSLNVLPIASIGKVNYKLDHILLTVFHHTFNMITSSYIAMKKYE